MLGALRHAGESVPKRTIFGTPILKRPNSAIAGFLRPLFRRVFGTGSSSEKRRGFFFRRGVGQGKRTIAKPASQTDVFGPLNWPPNNATKRV
jgi:hypothetical protein